MLYSNTLRLIIACPSRRIVSRVDMVARDDLGVPRDVEILTVWRHAPGRAWLGLGRADEGR